MTDRLFPFALRELRADFSKRPVLVGVIGLGVILGISGPFDTLEVLPALPRTLYWIVVVALTFGTGSFVSTLVHRALDRRIGRLAYLVSSVAIGVAVTLVLVALNFAVFGLRVETWGGFLGQLGIVTLISAVVEGGGLALRGGAAAAEAAPEASPAILERLPFDKRGRIVALSAEDHYVRVATTKGSELVLMRLTDAIKEVGTTEGLQVHRSHWIALAHVQSVRRMGDRAEAQSADGETRPISRGYMSAARAAGLLPGKPGA